jgi:hypothetical protein
LCESFLEDPIQEFVDPGLKIVWTMFARLDGDGSAQDLAIAHELSLDDVAQLLICSQCVEAGLLQQLEKDTD